MATVVGVPKEIKDMEGRVSMQPEGVAELVHHGHEVFVQAGAGEGAGFSDEEYDEAGARLVDGPNEVFESSDLIVKVEESDGSLPLLTPMSEVAGRMSVQAAAHHLESPQGGAGLLLGGVPGTPAAKVTIIGGGVVGTEATKIALGMRALVSVLDISAKRLAYLSDIFEGRADLVIPNRARTAAYVKQADVVIGAVLVHGAKAPKLVTREMVASMRPGSVVADVAIDQGGCIETARPTTHSDPTYIEEGVVHYCVANIPGAVARTSTLALTSATLPYLIRIADKGIEGAATEDEALAKGLSTLGGDLVSEPVAEAHDLSYTDAEKLLS